MLSLRNAVKNTGWLALEQVIRLLGSLLVTGLIARQLGPASFGWLNYAISIVALLTPIAGLGLNEVIARRVFRAEDADEKRAFVTAIRLRLLAGILLLASISGLVAVFYSDSHMAWLIVLCSGALVAQAPGVLDAYFQVRLQHGSAVVRRLAGFALTIGVKIGLLLMEAPLWMFALSTAFDALINGLSLVVALGGEARAILLAKFSRSEARELLGLSWPLITSGVLVALYFRVEQFIVLMHLGDREYGVYMSAVRMVAVINLIIPPVMSSLFPLLAEKSHQKNVAPGELPAGFASSLGVFSLGACGLSIFVAVGGWFFVEWILGVQYAPAKGVLMILPLGIPAIVSGGVRAHYLNLTKQNYLHNWAAIAGLIVNVFLAIVLIPRFGLPGAAWASVISAYLSAIGTSWFFRGCRVFGIAQVTAFIRFRSLSEMATKLRQAMKA
jgi:PST family polysaccharide transporter